MESWRIVMGRHGLSVSHEVLRSIIGVADHEFIVRFLAEKGINDDPDTWLTEKRDMYFGLIQDGVRPLPGALELVGMLAARMAIAIATSSARRELASIAADLGIDHLLAATVTKEDVDRHKPAPDCYLLAAERAGVEPDGCVVFEDSIAGVAAAKAAGMQCVAVTNSFTAGELAAADLIIASLEETYPILDLINGT